MIHPTADVETEDIGEDTTIWRWTHISKGVTIGNSCMIGANVYIGPNVTIGDNTRIQNNCFIPEGVTIGDNVFIGPGLMVTNDKFPPSDRVDKTVIEDGVVIGINTTIVAPVTITKNSKVGASCVIRRDLDTTKIKPGKNVWLRGDW